jgi:hypothetical protein
LAPRLPLLQGEGGGADGTRGQALLAVWALALVYLGELEAKGAAELQALWRPALLVAQQEKHRLQRVRDANVATLTRWRKGAETPPVDAEGGGVLTPFRHQEAAKQAHWRRSRPSEHRLHNRHKCRESKG